jgi:hypothetical protein
VKKSISGRKEGREIELGAKEEEEKKADIQNEIVDGINTIVKDSSS